MLPIRQELTILSADPVISIQCKNLFIIDAHGKFIRKKNGFFGWKIIEKIGIGIINTRGIVKLKMGK